MSKIQIEIMVIKRSNGYEIDNLIYDVDYMYHIFTSDIGTKFITSNQMFWNYYTFNIFKAILLC